MAFVRSTLELIGSDPRVLMLPTELALTLCCRPRLFEKDGVQKHIVLLTIVEEDLAEEEGVARTMNWLNHNREKLECFAGAITLEILCSLELEDASRYLRITAEAVELLFDLQCEVLLQYSRTFPSDGRRS